MPTNAIEQREKVIKQPAHTSHMSGLLACLSSQSGGKSPKPDTFSDNGGYYVFPNGLIMQWGKGSGFPNLLYKIYFPIPFPHKVMSVELTSQNNLVSSSDVDSFHENP